MDYASQFRSSPAPVSRSQNNYGLSAESFADVQRFSNSANATGVHMRPQQEFVQSQPQQQQSASNQQLTLAQSQLINQLKEALEYQAMQFDRYRDLTEKKFTSLSKDLLDLTFQLKDAKDFISKMRDKQDVQATRQALHQYQQGDRPAHDQPIDRNGVSPSSVQIQDIFNCSGKRF